MNLSCVFPGLDLIKDGVCEHDDSVLCIACLSPTASGNVSTQAFDSRRPE